jgi:hypothetical protein
MELRDENDRGLHLRKAHSKCWSLTTVRQPPSYSLERSPEAHNHLWLPRQRRKRVS